jgi:hypothetical protein
LTQPAQKKATYARLSTKDDNNSVSSGEIQLQDIGVPTAADDEENQQENQQEPKTEAKGYTPPG